MRLIAVAAAATLLASCGTVSRIASFSGSGPAARPAFNAYRTTVYVHPREDMLMIQPAMGQIGDATSWPDNVFRAAATYLIRPVGCTVGEPVRIGGGTYEAPFTCPAGVDLRALLRSQRDAVIAGAPLHP